MRGFAASRLEQATKLKDEGNDAYKANNLLAAYELYTKAKDILLSTADLELDFGDVATWEAAVAGRQVLAVVCGNLAAVCSTISPAATIQHCQDALQAIWDTTSDGYMPLVMRCDTKPRCASQPNGIRWDLVVKNCQRRLTPYKYYGALGNAMADLTFCRSVRAKHLGGFAALSVSDNEGLEYVLEGCSAYQKLTLPVHCMHSCPEAEASLFHRTAHLSSALKLMPQVEFSSDFSWEACATSAMKEKYGADSVWLLGPTKRGSTLLFHMKLMWIENQWQVAMYHSQQKVGGGAYAAVASHNREPVLVGGTLQKKKHADGGEVCPGMQLRRPYLGDNGTLMPRPKICPPALTRHTGVVAKLAGRDTFVMYGGILLEEWHEDVLSVPLVDSNVHSLNRGETMKLPRGSSYGSVWGLDLDRNAWKELTHSPGGQRRPPMRNGHVSWIYKNFMMIFGGCFSVLEGGTTNLGLDDLWAFDLSSHRWHQIHAAGLCPSPRCDMGLAVAEGGGRVYIVGGRAQVEFDLKHPCIPRSGASAAWFSAEIFELDLGPNPIGDPPKQGSKKTAKQSKGTARWRQVLPDSKGASWMPARASPACHLFPVGGSEQLLCVGGEVALNGEQATPSATAVVFELKPCPPASSFEESHEAELLLGLKLKSQESAKAAKAAASSGQPKTQPGASKTPTKNGAKWPPEFLTLNQLKQVARPQDDMLGFFSITGSTQYFAPEDAILLKTSGAPFPFKFVGVHPKASHESLCGPFGPSVVHLGANERADYLGCSWLGVVNWEHWERRFMYNKVVRVFGTEQAAQMYFSVSKKYSLGHYHNFLEGAELRSWTAREKQYLNTLVGKADEIQIQTSITVDGDGARYRHLLLIATVGRVWMKVYSRQLVEECKEGMLVLGTLSHAVPDFEEYQSKEGPRCLRCRRQGQTKVCAGCELVRFCPDCGPAAWQEGHSRFCGDFTGVPGARAKDVMQVPEWMFGKRLDALLGSIDLGDLHDHLSAKRSVLELLDRNRLEKYCAQAAHEHPWALVLMLQAEQHAKRVVGCFGRTFLLCPHDIPWSELCIFLEDHIAGGGTVSSVETKLGSSWEEGKSIDDSMTVGEACRLYGKEFKNFALLHYREAQ